MGSDEQRQTGSNNSSAQPDRGQAPIQEAQHKSDGALRPEDHPIVGTQYSDYTGRTLRVIAIQPRDRLGRHVVGKLKTPGKDPENYATTLDVFHAVWVKRIPPMNPRDMKVG